LTGVIAGTIGYSGKAFSKHFSALRAAGLRALLLVRPRSRKQPAVLYVKSAILFCLIAGLFLSFYYARSSSAATTFTVNSLLDTGDASPDGACDDGTGKCTLRAAIQEANSVPGADAINFSVTGTIQLGSVLPDLSTDITINGPGANVLTVRRNTGGDYRIFTINNGVTAAFSGLTIANGNLPAGDRGGGIFNRGGTVTITNGTITGNSADGGGGISNQNAGTLTITNSTLSGNSSGIDGGGGGIFNSGSTVTITNSTLSGNSSVNSNGIAGGGISTFLGTVTITNSTLSANSAGLFGGGIYNSGSTVTITNSTLSANSAGLFGGGTYNSGSTVTITNSTLSGNSSGDSGGGIFNASGTLTITNGTIIGNSVSGGSNQGGGIFILGDTVNARSTIIAQNTATTSGPDVFGTLTSQGHNLIGNNSGATVTPATGDQIGTSASPIDPNLGALASNGGPTQTHALLPLSPAIDKGDDCVTDNSCSPTLAAALTTDQRGAGFPRKVGAHVDIGAYEVSVAVQSGSPSFVVNTTGDPGGDGFCSADECTLREAITAANAAAGTDTITFDIPGAGPHTISLLTALPNISTNTNIQGPGANLLTVQRSTAVGTPDFRIFLVQSKVFTTQPTVFTVISGLTISNGRFSAFGGGVANSASGVLTLTNCTVSGNTSDGTGGGVANSGRITVINSTLSGNTSLFGGGNGGGGINNGGSAELYDSAVIGNAGGGISNFRTLTLTNSTVSGNTSPQKGGGIHNYFGGVMTLVNSTVTNNRSDSNNSGAEQGGGIFVEGTVTLKNTIVAGNFRGTGATRDDIGGAVDGASSFNLIGDGTNMTGISNGSNGNQVGSAGSPINAMLGALGNNGGPTPTHLLLLGSPAINAGSNGNLPADTLDLNNNGNTAEPLPIDQRGVGFPRIVLTTVDIGAVEVNYAISATAGTPQSATVNTTFSTALKATVTESGIPQNNLSVTFTAPGSGASGAFGASTTAVAVTNSSGLATAPTFTANAIGGPYNVVASLAGNLATANFGLTNLKANQTINFSPIAGKTFGDPDFTVSPSASSGLLVSLLPSGNCTVTNSSPGMVHITGAGSCTITASQIGDASFNAAADVPRSFNINKAFANPSVTSSVNPADLNQSVTFTATLTGPSGTGTPTGTVQFKDGGTNLGTPVMLNASGAAQLTTSTLTTGNHNITADYSGDTNFLAVTGTLAGGQVVKAQPTLSINDVSIAEGHSGTSILNFTVTLSATSSLTVTANYATANGTATAPSDYTAIASTLLTFNPGDTSKTVAVTINGDVSFEPDETFTVNLSNPVNATISKSSGTGTIQNDDVLGGFFSFSSATYSVSEATGLVTVTVVRTNDVTQAANVDYATDDTGASTNCAALNTLLASQRCDYISVFGTLRFAANETQKTIDIPINLDGYTEGPETFTVKLSNSTGGAVLINPSSATVTITDSASPTPNAIDDTTDFVRQQYRDFLNRDADPAGLAFWKNNIDKCNDPAQRPPGQTLAACIEVQRILTSAAFFLSIEFKGTGGLVRDFYVASLLRPLTNNMPDYVEFMRDTQAIQRGVLVNQGNWQQTLDTNRQAFMNEFVTRAEFVALYPTTDTPTQYVDKLYQHANVTGTQQERLDAIEYFGGAATAADTGARARALLQVTRSGDFQARELNRAFVQMQYFGYLRRNPNDPPDGDFNGFNFWVNKLNLFNGDFLQAEMVKAFLRSGEYRSRFGQ